MEVRELLEMTEEGLRNVPVDENTFTDTIDDIHERVGREFPIIAGKLMNSSACDGLMVLEDRQ